MPAVPLCSTEVVGVHSFNEQLQVNFKECLGDLMLWFLSHGEIFFLKFNQFTILAMNEFIAWEQI